MRTTIRLDDRLYVKVKQYAAEKGKTFTAIVEEALRQTLNRREDMKTLEPVRLRTVGGKGPLPGIDLDDTASLLDRLDEQ